MKNTQLSTQLKAIYDLLYVFHKILIIRCTVYEKQPVKSYVTFIWPLEVN